MRIYYFNLRIYYSNFANLLFQICESILLRIFSETPLTLVTLVTAQEGTPCVFCDDSFNFAFQFLPFCHPPTNPAVFRPFQNISAGIWKLGSGSQDLGAGSSDLRPFGKSPLLFDINIQYYY